ncbi:very short patch repair endonuclease [Isoptericola sp. b408]|uniref:very short patch repair endonuclease n=1 Tax=Isoptericola sp. b408 TaxID=3064653 RepID=UPI002712836D|nr:very short patch repair endonuclease [Isoptericola sp. b408]MDO8150201.1 very short patch repair endonuclease [Isoptericola sp. b408]
MSTARRRDTAPEMALRRELHARGLRYRVGFPVPGQRRRTIDVAFTRARVAVFVDGCFWHGCPEHGNAPRSNAEWWRTKLAANMDRDRDTDRLLDESGWRVVRIWEHESVAVAADKVEAAVRPDGLRSAMRLR